MKTIISIFVSILVCSAIGLSQDSVSNESNVDFTFDVQKIYPAISISRAKLSEATKMSDLYRQFKASWISEYKSVEIIAEVEGKEMVAAGADDKLTKDQLHLIAIADINTPIRAEIYYIPDNNLKHNDVQDYNFTFTIDPEVDATYKEGREELMSYIEENVISKFSPDDMESNALAAVQFTVSEAGQVENIRLSDSSRCDNIDEILLSAMNKMSNWNPAQYHDGTKTSQEMVLTVGNMKSCVINTYNVDPDKFAPEEE